MSRRRNIGIAVLLALALAAAGTRALSVRGAYWNFYGDSVSVNPVAPGQSGVTVTCDFGSTSPTIEVMVNSKDRTSPWAACSATGWSGTKRTFSCTALSQQGTYRNSCRAYNSSGYIQGNYGTYVTVGLPGTPTPTPTLPPLATPTPLPTPTAVPLPVHVSLLANGQSGAAFFPSPASFLLSWAVTGSVDQCTGTGPGWNTSSNGPTAGTQPISDLPEGNYTYVLSCTGPAGNFSAQLAVTSGDQLSALLYTRYSAGLYKGPQLPTPQPSQSFLLTVHGGLPPYKVILYYKYLGDAEETPQIDGSWCPSDGAALLRQNIPVAVQNVELSVPDPLFGLDHTGRWIAWAEVEDNAGNSVRTCESQRGQGYLPAWVVSWYPVSNIP